LPCDQKVTVVIDYRNILKNPTYRAMRRAEELVELCACGNRMMIMLCSDPGMGKTEIVAQVLRRNHVDHHNLSPGTTASFVDALWVHRNSLLWIDDCEALAHDLVALSIGKSFWGASAICISPSSKRIDLNELRRIGEAKGEYDPTIAPPEFRRGPNHALVWCTNHNYSDPTKLPKRIATDFAALISKGLDPLWIPSDPQHCFDYTIWMVLNGMLRRHPLVGQQGSGGFSLEIAQASLDFFIEKYRWLPEVTPRIVTKLATARRTDPHWQDEWERMASGGYKRGPLELPEDRPIIGPVKVPKSSGASSSNLDDYRAKGPEVPPDPEPDPPVAAPIPGPVAPTEPASVPPILPEPDPDPPAAQQLAWATARFVEEAALLALGVETDSKLRLRYEGIAAGLWDPLPDEPGYGLPVMDPVEATAAWEAYLNAAPAPEQNSETPWLQFIGMKKGQPIHPDSPDATRWMISGHDGTIGVSRIFTTIGQANVALRKYEVDWGITATMPGDDPYPLNATRKRTAKAAPHVKERKPGARRIETTGKPKNGSDLLESKAETLTQMIDRLNKEDPK
jgi:hypothetical protein